MVSLLAAIISISPELTGVRAESERLNVSRLKVVSDKGKNQGRWCLHPNQAQAVTESYDRNWCMGRNFGICTIITTITDGVF
jgi:hypothetical protein